MVQALEVCTFSQQLWLGEIPAHLPMVLRRVGNVGENGYLTGRYKNGTWQMDSCCMYANDRYPFQVLKQKFTLVLAALRMVSSYAGLLNG